MTIYLFVFYVLAFVATVASVMVVASRNPVHSVLFLILAFFNAAGLFVLIGAEFLAMILVVVYVGAVAVLFMFVVMMLDISTVRVREGALKFLPVGLLVGIVLLVELILVGGTWALVPSEAASPVPVAAGGITNTEALGRLLYTDYIYAFQAAGVILLVAIMGAIALTLRERGTIRRQSISMQVHRSRADAVQLRKVKSRAGI